MCKLSFCQTVYDVYVAVAKRLITSDLLRVRAAGGIISAMPAVISSSRRLRKLPQAADPWGLETPRNIVYSRYRDRSKRRRRHVRSQRARFRRVTRAQVLKRRMIKLLDTCLPLAFSLIGYKIRLLKRTLLIHCDACAENIYWKRR